MLQNAPPTACV